MFDQNISKKEKELVIARLEVLSPELHFSVGSDSKNLSRDEMIQQIMEDSAIGKEFVKIDLNFLRALKDGSLMKELIPV